MQTALDAPANALDESERSFVAKVREHGWFRTGALGDDDGPGFSFTTGFRVSANHPEPAIFSTGGDIAHDVFRDAKLGQTLPPGKRTTRAFGRST